MQTDLAIGRLRKEPSYIDCSSIFTVEKKLVIKVVSRLTTKALDEVKGELKRVLGLK